VATKLQRVGGFKWNHALVTSKGDAIVNSIEERD